MNASELSRQLLYCGHTELSDYLKNSPLNRYLYKQFLNIIPKYEIDVPMVQLYNEIYYQCVRLNYDGTPGVEIKQRYFVEELDWIQSKPAGNLIFIVVWAILKAKKKLTFQEDCFLSQMTPYIENNEMVEIGRTIYTELRYLEIQIPDPFPTLTCPLDGIPKFEIVKERNRSLNDLINASVEKKLNLENQFFELHEHMQAWRTVTSDYSHSVIESYVRLYSSAEDQLELIDRIQKTLPRDEIINLDGFFKDLVGKIKTGNFNLEGSCEEEIVDDLKEERDCLKAQIDELHKSHEMELAKMEAQFKAEIDKIKKERNKLAHEPETSQEQVPANGTKELTLTLSEITAFVKERFSKSGADEICTMLYGKAAEHGYLGENTFKLIDGIVPAVIERDKPLHKVDISQANQVNINPQEVVNHFEE